MRCGHVNPLLPSLIHGDVTVILFIDVEILDKSSCKEVIKVHRALSERFKVSGCNLRLPTFHYNQGSTNSTFVRCNLDSTVVVIHKDRDEF